MSDEVELKTGEPLKRSYKYGQIIAVSQGHSSILTKLLAMSYDAEYFVDFAKGRAKQKIRPDIYMHVSEVALIHLKHIFTEDSIVQNFLHDGVENLKPLTNFLETSRVASSVSQNGVSAYAYPRPWSGEFAGLTIRDCLMKGNNDKSVWDLTFENFEKETFHLSLRDTFDRLNTLITHKDENFVRVRDIKEAVVIVQQSLENEMKDDLYNENLEKMFEYARQKKQCPLLLLYNISSNELLSSAISEITNLYIDKDVDFPMTLFDTIRLVCRFLMCYIADCEVGFDKHYFGSKLHEQDVDKNVKIDFLNNLLLEKFGEKFLEKNKLIENDDTHQSVINQIMQIDTYYNDIFNSATQCLRFLKNPKNETFLQNLKLFNLLFETIHFQGISEIERFNQKYKDVDNFTVSSITLTDNHDKTSKIISITQVPI
jgi:hypothetical protein